MSSTYIWQVRFRITRKLKKTLLGTTYIVTLPADSNIQPHTGVLPLAKRFIGNVRRVMVMHEIQHHLQRLDHLVPEKVVLTFIVTIGHWTLNIYITIYSSTSVFKKMSLKDSENNLITQLCRWMTHGKLYYEKIYSIYFIDHFYTLILRMKYSYKNTFGINFSYLISMRLFIMSENA